MCIDCENSDLNRVVPSSRRTFIKFAGAAAASSAIPVAAFAQKAPPKPANVLSPDAALDQLVKGNARYVDGVAKRHDFKHEREALTTGQNPYAGILSCADSRIAPEYAFDAGRGDLFVCRVAGNFLNPDGIASFEYAVQVLNTPLLMVLGHQSCGAVDAAIKSIKDSTTLPGHLPSLVTALSPAVKAVLDKGGNTLDNAIRQNVVLNVERLKSASPIIDKFVGDKKVRVVGGIYHLDTGRVEVFV
ncbi:MAG: carbonic anhydrase [Xanthobacteraceae bacterium]